MRCLFYQHNHIFKTQSNSYFKELLVSLGFEITIIGRDDYIYGQSDGFDLIVLFQADNLIAEFENSKLPILIVPMLDEALHQKSSFFRHSRRFQYVSFAKDLHEFLTLSGNRSTYLQYWPPIPTAPVKKNPEIFFWERTPTHVSFQDVQKWFEDCNYLIKLRQHWDPGHSGIRCNSDHAKLKIVDSDWYTYSKFQNNLSHSQIFVAPRRWEGIGLTALEAMGHGNAIVGLDSPSLNDYVVNGETGFLIKQKNKNQSLGKQDWENIGRRARIEAQNGREIYLSESEAKMRKVISDAQSRTERRRLSMIPSNLTLRKFIFFKDLQA